LTNTNWQNYGGETTMSYFSQIGALTRAAVRLSRGGNCRGHRHGAGLRSAQESPTIGNFWVDITRCMFYILLPIAFIFGIIFVGEGAVQTLSPAPPAIH
jgi:K+-transporting ATPase ATPase A chain